MVKPDLKPVFLFYFWHPQAHAQCPASRVAATCDGSIKDQGKPTHFFFFTKVQRIQFSRVRRNQFGFLDLIVQFFISSAAKMPCRIPSHTHDWPRSGTLSISKCESKCGFCSSTKDYKPASALRKVLSHRIPNDV